MESDSKAGLAVDEAHYDQVLVANNSLVKTHNEELKRNRDLVAYANKLVDTHTDKVLKLNNSKR